MAEEMRPQAHHADEDQIDRYQIVQRTRNREDQNAEDQRASERVLGTRTLTSHRKTAAGPARGAYSRLSLKVKNRASIRLAGSTVLSIDLHDVALRV